MLEKLSQTLLQEEAAEHATAEQANDCINDILFDATTGNGVGATSNAGFCYFYIDDQHFFLDGQKRGFYQQEFHVSNCIDRNAIRSVSINCYQYNQPYDGWFLTSVETYARANGQIYTPLTSNPNLNQWVGYNQDTDVYDPNNFVRLTIVREASSTDTPECGYGNPVCYCSKGADECVFNLEIDEIMTFTSYQKHGSRGNEGLDIRELPGVVYYIDEYGEAQSHPALSHRKCAQLGIEGCTDPQFVDGKTYRLGIAVNAQIPGPTLVVHDGQLVKIHVHNNMSSQGISIHWHGMFQKGTPWMDGVGQVTQCQIGPSSTYTYIYRANPSGTFWYHSHSGAQRTDGFFGALIVMEKDDHYSTVRNKLGQYSNIPSDFEDLPGEHSITLLDWQHEDSFSLFSQLGVGPGFYPEMEIGEIPQPWAERYITTRSYERGEAGVVPYYSGLINGKGRHEGVPYTQTRLSVFTVEQGKSYRFRLIGAQGLYAYKFSIGGHKLIVVATDGFWIEPLKVDYIIIHSGERYDFILEANEAFDNYWIRAETLEIYHKGVGPPYTKYDHVAEGILQYKLPGQNAPPITSDMYESIKLYSDTRACNRHHKCSAVNCPFQNFHYSYYIDCINVQNFQLLLPTPQDEMPALQPSCSATDGCLHFINFNFEGNSDTSSVNGRNFILPAAPPLTQYEDFEKEAIVCSLSEDCNPYSIDCTCTQVIDIPHDETIQLVFSAIGSYDNAHPIHLHGHTFHVVKVGYPEYDRSTGMITQDRNGVSMHTADIACDDKPHCQGQGPECNPNECTRPSWASGSGPDLYIDETTVRKDTVIVPAGGYVVINFKSDNPGWWFLHCHIEVHQLQGMSLIINEAFEEQKNLVFPDSLNKCGDFILSEEEYYRLYGASK